LRERIVAGRDYVFFDTLDDMIDKVRFYSKNDTARDQIARKGREFYEQLYDVGAHARELDAALFPGSSTVTST
jgi:glycosyltransferase involved in cell wall biosynthesis